VADCKHWFCGLKILLFDVWNDLTANTTIEGLKMASKGACYMVSMYHSQGKSLLRYEKY